MNLDRDELAKLDPVQQNVIVIVQAMLEHQTPPGDAEQTFEPALAVEACIVAAAAIMEASADEGLTARAERAARKLAEYASAFRAEHAMTGKSGLEQLGAATVTRRVIQ